MNKLIDDKVHEQSLLEYPKQNLEKRYKFLEGKTVSELNQTSWKQIQDEFELLSSAQVSEKFLDKKHQNMDRYRDIMPYRHSRVKIQHIPDFYINASEVKSMVDNQVFAIFGQAPVRPFDSIWAAVYFKKIPIIIMLCSFVDPKRGRQADRYWPDVGKSVQFLDGRITLTTLQITKKDPEIVQTIISINGPDGEHILTHYHWKGWLDLKKPVNDKIVKLEEIIKICLNLIEKGQVIWIHCSAGIGRTGTLGGIIEGLRLFQKHKKVSVFQIVENMRKQRFQAVPSLEQYQFLYSFLEKHIK